MVNIQGKHEWSSYQLNALGKAPELCSPHSLYLGLANNLAERLFAYQKLSNMAFASQ